MELTPEQGERLRQICELVRECIQIGIEQERERCAKIADLTPRGAAFSDEFEAGYDDACKRIAEAIRGQKD